MSECVAFDTDDIKLRIALKYLFISLENPFTEAVRRQELQDDSSQTDTGSPRKRKNKSLFMISEPPSPLKRKAKDNLRREATSS